MFYLLLDLLWPILIIYGTFLLLVIGPVYLIINALEKSGRLDELNKSSDVNFFFYLIFGAIVGCFLGSSR